MQFNAFGVTCVLQRTEDLIVLLADEVYKSRHSDNDERDSSSGTGKKAAGRLTRAGVTIFNRLAHALVINIKTRRPL
jgi:hypothetical protein